MRATASERWQWTAPRYLRAVEAGLIDPSDRLELIEGELIRMVPINPRHSTAVDELLGAIAAQLDRERFRLRVQQPLAFADDTWPEPDLAIVCAGEYREQHPGPDDTRLVIEVSDSSFERDRGSKLVLYARHQIPEYWVVDVRSASTSIWVYRTPRGERYEDEMQHREGRISSNSVAALVVDVDVDVDVL